MCTDFEITSFSESRYEELMVEISYKEQVLCQLYKDNGLDKVEIEFFSDAQLLTSQDAMKFSLDDFYKFEQRLQLQMS